MIVSLTHRWKGRSEAALGDIPLKVSYVIVETWHLSSHGFDPPPGSIPASILHSVSPGPARKRPHPGLHFFAFPKLPIYLI